MFPNILNFTFGLLIGSLLFVGQHANSSNSDDGSTHLGFWACVFTAALSCDDDFRRTACPAACEDKGTSSSPDARVTDGPTQTTVSNACEDHDHRCPDYAHNCHSSDRVYNSCPKTCKRCDDHGRIITTTPATTTTISHGYCQGEPEYCFAHEERCRYSSQRIRECVCNCERYWQAHPTTIATSTTVKHTQPTTTTMAATTATTAATTTTAAAITSTSTPPPPIECLDHTSHCASFVNECDRDVVKSSCPVTCGVCKVSRQCEDDSAICATLDLSTDICDDVYVRKTCQKTCSACGDALTSTSTQPVVSSTQSSTTEPPPTTDPPTTDPPTTDPPTTDPPTTPPTTDPPTTDPPTTPPTTDPPTTDPPTTPPTTDPPTTDPPTTPPTTDPPTTDPPTTDPPTTDPPTTDPPTTYLPTTQTPVDISTTPEVTTPPPERTTETTTPSAPRQCYQCGSDTTPCTTFELLAGQPSECPTGLDFCASYVNQLGSSRTVIKKCISRDTCVKDWFEETSDDSSCVSFDPKLRTSDIVCNYCCIGDNCNKGVKPAINSLFTITKA